MSDQIPSVMEFSTDIGEQEAPVPLPDGLYTASIRGVDIRESQRGTKYAAVQFHIAPDQYPADFQEGDPDGEIIVFRRVPMEDTQRARYQLRRFIEAIGAVPSRRIDVNEWVGLEGSVEVVHEEYEGTPRATIKSVSKSK